ncbi:hypothetical protein M8C21_016502 [Ambrosia artemisiifolia]|uniref:Uncharacterized protein n=1 Tax=Ambrosia artemisiifolia TaxID=4212 RepID=A0AAD5DF84_AMBAR|nr:hypothetical protein M8C21_016502 [Ambrosia artemisiifolia]
MQQAPKGTWCQRYNGAKSPSSVVHHLIYPEWHDTPFHFKCQWVTQQLQMSLLSQTFLGLDIEQASREGCLNIYADANYFLGKWKALQKVIVKEI